MPVVLLDLSVYIFFVGCLIFCYLCVLIVKAFFAKADGLTSWIPWVGGWIHGGLTTAEQHIVDVFSKGVAKSEAAIGWTWHLSARLIDHLGREIAAHSNLLWLLANQIPGVGLVRNLIALVHTARAEIARLWHNLHTVPHAIAKPIYGELKALERWTYPRVKAAEHAIDVTIPKDIAGLRSRTKTIEGELSRLWDAIKAEKAILATTAFVGAVALALSRLGMGWLRCDSATQLGKKYGCGLWPKLDKLLGLLGEVLLVTNICTVIPWLEAAFSEIAAPAVAALTSVGAGLCGPGSAPPELLPNPGLYLPAQVDDTLHLAA